MSTGWSIFVTVVTLGMLAGCWLLLILTRRSEVEDGEHTYKDHAFDGITELETPLPRWWYYAFLGTILFGAAYLVLYPGLGNWSGTLGWSQTGQWSEEVARAKERYSPLFDRYAATPVDELVHDRKALRMGQRIFGNFCSQCHGTAAQGNAGFPNLTDDAWIWGSSPAAISTSITQGRRAVMPAWQAPLGEGGVAATTQYVLSLSGRATDPAEVEAGATHYATFCVACHGAEGKGNPLLGAPNLTDDAWLYGGRAENISTSIAEGRNGVMPAHGDLLDPARIHLVTTWVYSLRGTGSSDTSAPAGGP
ncbi:MAG TPA: cytochrome-c oxidase, cbb3-type subunit III [Pseudomonadales bacterium]|nr:cytochrome-c oxidase, cbb3-type subunit III [Pseudomonadales bacterium]